MAREVRNKDIRMAMYLARVKQWEVAEQLGVSEVTVCRWLRTELPDDKKRAILDAIKCIEVE